MMSTLNHFVMARVAAVGQMSSMHSSLFWYYHVTRLTVWSSSSWCLLWVGTVQSLWGSHPQRYRVLFWGLWWPECLHHMYCVSFYSWKWGWIFCVWVHFTYLVAGAACLSDPRASWRQYPPAVIQLGLPWHLISTHDEAFTKNIRYELSIAAGQRHCKQEMLFCFLQARLSAVQDLAGTAKHFFCIVESGQHDHVFISHVACWLTYLE